MQKSRRMQDLERCVKRLNNVEGSIVGICHDSVVAFVYVSSCMYHQRLGHLKSKQQLAPGGDTKDGQVPCCGCEPAAAMLQAALYASLHKAHVLLAVRGIPAGRARA